jgi:molecular chaperone DnaJ
VEVSLEEAYRGTTRTISVQTVDTCPVCKGTGDVAGTVCVTCDGTGQAPKTKRLEVRVPAGVKTGSRVRVAGEGRAGIGGGSSGDLYLTIAMQTHSKFERKGDDLTVEVPVGYADAVLGGEVEVPTLEGRLMLKVPPLTQNGRQIKLTGKGMPVLGADKKGDLFVRVRVQLPEQLSDEERLLFEQLRELQAKKAGVR